MASNVLPLATLKVLQNPHQCYQNKLGLSTHARTGCSSIGYRGLSPALRVSSSSSVVRHFNSIIAFPTKPSFVVRAESSENEEEKDENEGKSEEPKQPRVKLGDIMGILNRRAIEAADKQRPTPDLRTGDIVEIKWAVPENKRRFSIYRGIVISKQNAGIHTTIRIRRIIAGIGVEIVFPIYSPSLKEIKVVNHRKVRRARLYYLRDKLPRFSSFKW